MKSDFKDGSAESLIQHAYSANLFRQRYRFSPVCLPQSEALDCLVHALMLLGRAGARFLESRGDTRPQALLFR
jgi:hypothetical protein